MKKNGRPTDLEAMARRALLPAKYEEAHNRNVETLLARLLVDRPELRVAGVETVEVREGDTILVRFPEQLTPERANGVVERFRELFPQAKAILMLEGDVDLAVIRDGEEAPADG